MRNTQQRVEAARLGAKKIQRKQAHKRLRMVTAGIYAASLALVVVLGAVVQGFDVNGAQSIATSGASASIFASSPILGYIMVGCLSFLLGGAVTILCLLLHRRAQQEEAADDD